MTEPNAPVRSNREAIRWGLLIASVTVSGYRLPKTVHDLRNWRSALPIDPSAAELYRVRWMVDVIGIAVVLCVGLGVFYLLRSAAVDRR